MRRGLGSLILAASLLVSLAAGTAMAQTEVLEIAIRDTRLAPDGTTEIVVNVTGGARPDVLDDGAFSVREQGEPVDGLTVEPYLGSGVEDVIVALVLDTSGSMSGEPLEQVQAAAIEAVNVLTDAGVQVSLVEFNNSATVLVPPTPDAARLVDSIESLQATGRTALYDAIVDTAAELGALPEAQANMIVIADGDDNESSASLQDAVAAATDIDAPVSIVALEFAVLDLEVLQSIAEQTGGRLTTAEETGQIGAVIAEAVDDVASQYRLVYTSARFEDPTLDLTVEVTADGEEAVRTFSVANVRDTPIEALPAPRTVEGGGTSLLGSQPALYLGLFAAFAALLLLFGFLFSSARTRADRVLGDQLARYIEGRDARAGRSSLVAAHFRDRAMDLLESTPRPRGFDAKLTHRLEQAAWPLRNSEFLLLVAGSALMTGLLVGFLFNPLGGILLALIAGAIPYVILAVRRQRRLDAFLRHLPDTLQLFAGSLRAGYAVLQAIDSVAKESSPPTSEEFGRVLTETRLGMPLEDALEAMAVRIDNDDFRWVVLAINIQREVGGNLAELLDTVAEVLREREMLRRQIKVLSAEGRLSAVVLIALPIVLAIYLILVRPEYIGTLVTSGAFGWLLVITAVTLMLGGILWIRKLIRIEV